MRRPWLPILLPILLVGAASIAAHAAPRTHPFEDLGDAVQARLALLTEPAGRAERRESKALSQVEDLLSRAVDDLADELKVARKIEARVARKVPAATGLETHLDSVATALREAVESEIAFTRTALRAATLKRPPRERVDQLMGKADELLIAATNATSRKQSLSRLTKALGRVRDARRLFVKKDVVTVEAALSSPTTQIADARILEGSGIVSLGGSFWTHGDGGNGARLYASPLVDFSAAVEFEIDGAVNVDWEDLAVLDGDLLVCDIGDNLRQRVDLTLYRVQVTDGIPALIATHPFTYPDGAHDAEAVTVIDGRVHVFTKGDFVVGGSGATNVYRFDTLLDGEPNVPVRVGSLDLPAGILVTAADVDPRTGSLALLAYGGVLVYPPGSLTGAPDRLVPAAALQSEALCFHGDTLVVTNEQRDVYLVPSFLDRR